MWRPLLVWKVLLQLLPQGKETLVSPLLLSVPRVDEVYLLDLLEIWLG